MNKCIPHHKYRSYQCYQIIICHRNIHYFNHLHQRKIFRKRSYCSMSTCMLAWESSSVTEDRVPLYPKDTPPTSASPEMEHTSAVIASSSSMCTRQGLRRNQVDFSTYPCCSSQCFATSETPFQPCLKVPIVPLTVVWMKQSQLSLEPQETLGLTPRL